MMMMMMMMMMTMMMTMRSESSRGLHRAEGSATALLSPNLKIVR